jgi:hypothetical protein
MKNSSRILDWNTPLNEINIGQHWRIGLCIIIFATLATVVWHALFPHTMFFLKLWTGFATGSLVGTFVGTYWQFQNKNRRAKTSGWFLLLAFLGWGAFATISCIMLAPQMRAEESLRSEIRSLSTKSLILIQIKGNGALFVSINNADEISQFCQLASNSELFYPSHEGSLKNYELSMSFRDKKFNFFKARIPERHPKDLSLDYNGLFFHTEVIVPGGACWIEKSITKRNRQQKDLLNPPSSGK